MQRRAAAGSVRAELQRSSVGYREAASSVVLRVLQESHAWQRSLDELSRRRDARQFTQQAELHATIAACQGEWVAALALLASMEHFRLERDVVSISVAIGACATGGEWQRALGLFWQARASSIAPNQIVYVNMMRGCHAPGAWRVALELLAEMGRAAVERDRIVYHCAARVCTSEEGWRHVLQLLEQMQTQSISWDCQSYLRALDACLEGAAWQNALQLLREMRDRGHEPTAATVLVVMSTCGAAISLGISPRESEAAAQQAVAMLQAMKGDALRPDVTHYNSAMSLAQAVKWESSLDIFEQACSEDISRDLTSFTRAMKVGAHVRLWDGALHLLTRARSLSLQPGAAALDPVAYAGGQGQGWHTSLRLLADARSRFGAAPGELDPCRLVGSSQRWKLALAALKDASLFSLRPDTMASISSAAGKVCDAAGLWQRSLHLLAGQTSQDEGLQREEYIAAIGLMLRGALSSKPGVAPDEAPSEQIQAQPVAVDKDLAARQRAARRAAQAATWPEWGGPRHLDGDAREAGEADATAKRVAAEAGFLVSERDWELALGHLHDMQRLSLPPGVDAYTTVIRACDLGRQWERALDLLHQMRAQAVPPGSQAYGGAVSACDRCGQLVKALKLLDDMHQHTLEPDMVTYNIAIGSARGTLKTMKAEAQRLQKAQRRRGGRRPPRHAKVGPMRRVL
ncbi:unnamed protein product [Prorocentrum cordatum]|uniref:Pentatricopeptide repeat-containing protein, chloroplastic n=1 Tax=Prorocentrum cordatum TaxID=2364126 RepID=A0ABN9R244_9DINO|nr:unnamed protein product [Polarella glacialis]